MEYSEIIVLALILNFYILAIFALEFLKVKADFRLKKSKIKYLEASLKSFEPNRDFVLELLLNHYEREEDYENARRCKSIIDEISEQKEHQL